MSNNSSDNTLLSSDVRMPSDGEIKANSSVGKKDRVWEIDFLRALCIFLVWFDHTMCDIIMCGPNFNTEFGKKILEIADWYWYCEYRMIIQPFMVYVFVALSGISCILCRNNFRRSLKMLCFSGLFTIITWWAQTVMGIGCLITFNIIHLVSVSTLVYGLMELFEKHVGKIPNIIIVVFALAMILFGEYFVYCVKHGLGPASEAKCFLDIYKYYNPEPDSIGSIFFMHSQAMSGKADFLPLFPSLGYFLMAAVFARHAYKDRKTLFPKFRQEKARFVLFCGRHTLWIYFGGQVVMFGLVYLLSSLIN